MFFPGLKVHYHNVDVSKDAKTFIFSETVKLKNHSPSDSKLCLQFSHSNDLLLGHLKIVSSMGCFESLAQDKDILTLYETLKGDIKQQLKQWCHSRFVSEEQEDSMDKLAVVTV